MHAIIATAIALLTLPIAPMQAPAAVAPATIPPATAAPATATVIPATVPATTVTTPGRVATEWRHGVTRIYIDCDAFAPSTRASGAVNVTRSVTMGDHGTLLVAVCSNPSTGFTWTWPTWTHSLFKYVARSYVEPATPMPGAAGKDLFRFVARHAGNGRIVLTYSQPWTGGQKHAWTLTLNVRAVTARPVPPVPPVPAVNAVVVTCDEFAAAQDAGGHAAITRSVTVRGALSVTLCSNGSTGFSWETPTFDATALELTGHTTASAASGLIGAAGTETWTFKVLKAVDSTVSFSYSRPWAGGEKGIWTLALTVHAS